MKEQINIQDYFNNPAGTGSAAITNRELVRGDLERRFNELYKNKKDLFLGNVYKNKDEYFIHVVIPSESKERNNTYDVVVKFIPNDNVSSRNTNTVKDYGIQLFSNSPSFTFTYAYVFEKEGLLVPELKNKFRDETFQPPTTRNPYEGINYEKTIFFGLMYILQNQHLLSKTLLARGRSLSQLNRVVRTTDTVSIQHSQEKNRLKELRTKEEIKNKKKEARNISIENKPRKGTKGEKTKPIKPRSKIKPKSKTTARTALKSAVQKRRKLK